jgi:type IV pilus assembly protein PilC
MARGDITGLLAGIALAPVTGLLSAARGAGAAPLVVGVVEDARVDRRAGLRASLHPGAPRLRAQARRSRPLATLLAGGITLVESWEIASESITNLELRRRSSSILPMIREGRSFTESLEAASWLPLLAIDMIGIGERSGSLREMLDEVAVFYDAESEVRLEQLTTTLEPAILIVMGGVVVTILLAIYLPIIQSISSGAGVTGAR